MNNKVLIIEDDREISSMVKMYLENEGYEVFTAFDGLEGLEAVNEFSPTVILLDLMMPRMDGMECLKKIREKSTTPVLITSAKNSDLDKALGLGFGAD
ncbi:MAG: response regulator, partial [Clostridium sp.]